MKPIVMPFVALVLTASSQTGAWAAELVANGGFETGDFSSWTRFGNPGNTAVGTGIAAQSGTYGAFFGPEATPGGIEQSISTQAGTDYSISFWLLNLSGGSFNSFAADFGGAPALLTLTNAPTSPWTLYSFESTATSAATTLRFEFRHDPAYWHIDDISVQALSGGPAHAVPEPGTWALMISGFGLAGAALRKRRWATA